MRKAFTLIEINLAILVMAGGILSVVVLYSLGYRETRQSREDIVSTAYSDAVLAPIVAKLSSTELSWEDFNKIGIKPDTGWGGYLNEDGTIQENTEAESHLSGILGGVSINKPPTGKFHSGLVVYHAPNSGVVKLGFRTSRRLEDLLTAPLYYTEVRFQGGFKENTK